MIKKRYLIVSRYYFTNFAVKFIYRFVSNG
jgi:hypothetical protein